MSVRPLVRAALPSIVGALLVAPVAWALARVVLDDRQAGELVVGSLGIALVLVAARAAWRAGRQPTADATAWQLIAASLAIFSLYVATSLLVELFGLGTGWVLAAGVFGLLFRLLMALAIVSFPLMAPTARSRWRARLDVLLVGTTVAFLAWAWVLSDLFHHAIPGTPAARAALFSLLDIVLVIIVLMASLRRPAGVRDATRLLGFGLVFLALTDWNLATSQTAGTTDTTPFAALSSFLALGFVAAGAWLAGRPTAEVERPLPRGRARDLLPIALAADHRATEAALAASGVPHVLMRHGWYADNYTAGLAAALDSGQILGAAGEGRISAASRADMAAGDATALIESKGGEIYEISGDSAFTMAEFAAEVARQAGRPVRYVNLPQAEYVAALEQAGLPDFIARMLGDSSFQTSKDVLYDTSGDLSRLIGRPTEPIAAVIARALGQT